MGASEFGGGLTLGGYQWRPDFWMYWPGPVRWLLAVAMAVGIGAGIPWAAAASGDGGRLVIVAAGMVVVGLLAACVSPLWPFAIWFGTLFHADLRPEGWPVSPGQAAGAALLLTGLGAVVAGRVQSLTRRPEAYLLVLMAMWLGISAWTSLDPGRGAALARYPVFYCAVALVLGATLRRHEDWRLLAWLMVLLTAAHAVPGLLEAQRRGTLDAAMAGQFSYGVRITGTAANPIVFGWNMIYGVPAALYLATVERQPLLRAVALGLGAFGLAVSFLTLNRQGFVLAAVAIGATVLLGPARHRKALAVGAGVAAGLGALALLPVMIRRLAASFSAAPGGASGGIFRDPSFLERHDAFLTGMQALLAHPVGGIGLGAFPYVWREFYPRDGSTYFYQSTLEVRYRYLDSGYMQVLVETGLAGTLVVGVAVGVLAWSVVRARRQLMVAGDRQAVAAAGWVLGLGTFVAVGTLVQDTLLNPRVWVLFGMGLGLVGMAQGRLFRTAD